MGNLIKDFWTFQYKGGSYYGIVEVHAGELEFRSSENKKETKIEKALAYAAHMDEMSHMSVQSYNEYLEKRGRIKREATDVAFYPFYVEFEPKKKRTEAGFAAEYKEAAEEAQKLVTYLVYEKDVDEKDIMILINNSRSIYVFVNPVSYGLMPENDLHKIYGRMFEIMNEDLNLTKADLKMYRFNGLIKTPGSYYAGGYVNPISWIELKDLAANPPFKQQLTERRRSIDIQIPGAPAARFKALYNSAKSNHREEYKNKKMKRAAQLQAQSGGTAGSGKRKAAKVTYMLDGIQCIKHIENTKIQEGDRNFALVSLAIAYKNAGYKIEQVLDIVRKKADEWEYDEADDKIKGEVECVFENDYNFSCKKVRQNIPEVAGMCGSCRCCCDRENQTHFAVYRDVINRLQAQKASLRHYKAYLILNRNNAFGRYIDLGKIGLDRRTVREMAKYIGAEWQLENGLVKLIFAPGGKKYILPISFIDQEMDNLGEALKPFLLLYVNFVYKATFRYGNMRVTTKRIQELLQYSSQSSVYALMKKLTGLGLAVFKQGYLVALYVESFKIIEVDFDRGKYKGNRKKRVVGHPSASYGDYSQAVDGDPNEAIILSRGSP